MTFIDKGKILLSGYKDEILDSHAVIKCALSDYRNIAAEDYIIARVNDFGADVMVCDRAKAQKKYPDLIIEKTTLEDIMLFYVNQSKKEWS